MLDGGEQSKLMHEEIETVSHPEYQEAFREMLSFLKVWHGRVEAQAESLNKVLGSELRNLAGESLEEIDKFFIKFHDLNGENEELVKSITYYARFDRIREEQLTSILYAFIEFFDHSYFLAQEYTKTINKLRENTQPSIEISALVKLLNDVNPDIIDEILRQNQVLYDALGPKVEETDRNKGLREALKSKLKQRREGWSGVHEHVTGVINKTRSTLHVQRRSLKDENITQILKMAGIQERTQMRIQNTLAQLRDNLHTLAADFDNLNNYLYHDKVMYLYTKEEFEKRYLHPFLRAWLPRLQEQIEHLGQIVMLLEEKRRYMINSPLMTGNPNFSEYTKRRAEEHREKVGKFEDSLAPLRESLSTLKRLHKKLSGELPPFLEAWELLGKHQKR